MAAVGSGSTCVTLSAANTCVTLSAAKGTMLDMVPLATLGVTVGYVEAAA